MVADQTLVSDGFSSLTGGADASLAPDLIGPTFYAAGVNISNRGGRPRTRPGMQFATVDWHGNTTAFNHFTDGYFQGAKVYRYNGVENIIAMVSGRIFRFAPNGYHTFDAIEITGYTLDPGVWRVAMCQADTLFVIQDGINFALILRGDAVFESSTYDNGVPIGTVMAYGLGRLWVANRNEYWAGDLLGTAPDSVIMFTETTYLNEGGSFKLPAEFGNVKAMRFVPQQDTATGQGPLLVFGEHGAETVFAQLDRSTWKNSIIQQEALRGIGCCGPDWPTDVNGDLWYRAPDGVRSYRQARAEQSGWGSLALSNELRQFFDADSPEWLFLGSAAFVNNRLFLTVLPQASNTSGGSGPEWQRAYHLGIAVIDFAALQTARTHNAMNPAWQGVWRGFFNGSNLPLAVIALPVAQRSLMFVLSNNLDGSTAGGNYLCELSDAFIADGSTAISWTLDTRAFSFGNDREEKTLQELDYWLTDQLGDVTINAWFRQDESPNWRPWETTGARSFPAPSGIGLVSDGAGAFNLGDASTRYQARVQLTSPPSDTDQTTDGTVLTNRIGTRCYTSQQRLAGTGHVTIARLDVMARRELEGINSRSVTPA